MALTPDHQLVLGILASQGTVSSAELQRATTKSQPTISRILADLGPQVVVTGRARATRYALGKSIHGRPSQHSLWWTDEGGRRTDVGTLTYLANDTVHVHSSVLGDHAGAALPWYLSPLKAEGFLGRLAGRTMASLGVEADPERWSIETILYAALQVHDAPGALTMGVQDHAGVALRLSADSLTADLDTAAARVATTLPVGSSAGGEQPKFLAFMAGWGHVIVKFTPPLRSPGGQRWSDLLHAEHLACSTLHENGIDAAVSQIVRTTERTYLISKRFDRIGPLGRRHVVSIGKAHEAFVQGAHRNWMETSLALWHRGSLSAEQADTVSIVQNFGRLIGNTDMHSGNLSLFVPMNGVRRGRFELAPVYDMLPMRWRPDPLQGGVQDYATFEPDDAALASRAVPLAHVFWDRVANCNDVSNQLREISTQMAHRVGAQGGKVISALSRSRGLVG